MSKCKNISFGITVVLNQSQSLFCNSSPPLQKIFDLSTLELSTSRELRQGEPPVEVAQHRPGRPLQLQQVLHRHLCESVGAVHLEILMQTSDQYERSWTLDLHDKAHHDCDKHLEQCCCNTKLFPVNFVVGEGGG